MKHVRALGYLAAFYLGACSAATEPTRPSVEFEVTGQHTMLEPPVNSTPYEANAAGGPGLLVIMGHIQTPTPCWDLMQSVTRSGSSVAITISAKEQSGICTQVILLRDYTLRVNGLTKGTYLVEVAHELSYGDGRQSRTLVVQKTVAVE